MAGFSAFQHFGKLGALAVPDGGGDEPTYPENLTLPQILTSPLLLGEPVEITGGVWENAAFVEVRLQQNPSLVSPGAIYLDWTGAVSGIGDATAGQSCYIAARANGDDDYQVINPFNFGPWQAEAGALPITSIDADGWQTVYPSVPAGPVLLEDVPVTRAGFTSTGTATTYSETLKLTKRIRQPYPNQASLSTNKVALSDFIYSTDTVAGVTNNSTLASPKPIAKWATLDRDTVGNSVTPELVAFHRDGVAYVEFRATDGTTTVTAGTSSQIVLGAATDQCAVLGYRATLDLTTLTGGLITVHAKVWPKFGGVGSVLNSSDKTDRRDFSARYYLKNVTLAAAPVYAYVSTSGNDATGAVSTTAATAEATPCATVGGALVRINAVHGAVDGCIIRVMAGTHPLSSPSGLRTQNISAVTVTRDPLAAKSAVILKWGPNFTPRLSVSLDAAIDTGCLRFRDITADCIFDLAIPRDGGKRLEIQVVDCVWDNNSFTSDMFNISDVWWVGTEYQGAAASATQPTPDGAHMMWRGCFGTMSNATLDAYYMIGCNFVRTGRINNGTSRDVNGSIRAFNKFVFATTTGTYVAVRGLSKAVTEGAVIAQNVFEGLPNSSFTLLVPSADGESSNLTHLVCIHNTITGFNDAGRSNILYNETTGLARSHTLHRVAGNIHVQLNTKHDIFALNGTRTGGWSYLYGVGCEGEFSQYRDAGSGSFAQEFAGLGANIGTSSSIRNDPLFTNYQGATAGAAGVGGGDYTLTALSPAIGVMPRELLPFDLAGNARNRLSTGAYR